MIRTLPVISFRPIRAQFFSLDGIFEGFRKMAHFYVCRWSITVQDMIVGIQLYGLAIQTDSLFKITILTGCIRQFDFFQKQGFVCVGGRRGTNG